MVRIDILIILFIITIWALKGVLFGLYVVFFHKKMSRENPLELLEYIESQYILQSDFNGFIGISDKKELLERINNDEFYDDIILFYNSITLSFRNENGDIITKTPFYIKRDI